MMSATGVKTAADLQVQRGSQAAEDTRLDSSRQFDCFIGVSSHIAELKDFISVQATISHPTLLIGERGLRQEQIARALRQASDLRKEPFFAVNARALNEDALRQLLFGPRGMLESTPRGTIYINELTGLPPLLLQRFAAYIEEQRWRARSGQALTQHLVFATEYDSSARAVENRLAYSLIEQLRSSSFQLKPLRERSEDIPYLAVHLATRIANRLGKSSHEITPEAMDMLMVYEWKQNIDELEAALENAIVNTPPPRIDETLLPGRVRHATLSAIPPDGIDLPRIVDDYERSIIETALRQTSGNQTKAARLLGLRVQTLNMKLKRFAELNKPAATVELAMLPSGATR